MKKATSLEPGWHRSSRRPKGQKGFTLVELMVVVAIIGILASIGLPALFRYVRNAEATEAVNMSGTIARNLLGYQQARGVTATIAASDINGKNVLSPVSSPASTLDLIIPQLQLPTDHNFSYTIAAGVTDSVLAFCIKAEVIPQTPVNANSGVQLILYSSTLSTDPSWNNHYNNFGYVTESTDAADTAASASCTNTGAFQ